MSGFVLSLTLSLGLLIVNSLSKIISHSLPDITLYLRKIRGAKSIRQKQKWHPN
jgi:hypothetical protein